MSEKNPLTNNLRISIFKDDQKIYEGVFSKGPIVFGRSASADIQLDFDFVSRQHGSIVEEGGKLYLLDLKSSNGIVVAGEKVKKYSIGHHVEAYVGKLKIVVHSFYNPEAKAKLPSAPSPDEEETQPGEFKTSATLVAPVAHLETPKTPPPPAPVQQTAHSDAVHFKKRKKPVIDRNFIPEMTALHGAINTAKYRKVEAVVTWHDQIYEVKEFREGDGFSVGPRGRASLSVPLFQDIWKIASVGKTETLCTVPEGSQITMNLGTDKITSMGDLLASKRLDRGSFGYRLKLGLHEAAHIDLGGGMGIHLRYVPASHDLPSNRMLEPDRAIRESIVSSITLHTVLMLICWAFAPPVEKGPKLKNVPERFARLLIEKPKPTPVPTPPPIVKKEPPKVVKKEPPKVIPKKIVKKEPPIVPKKIAKLNKFPMEVKHPLPKAPPPVKVEALGALAALGAISKSAPQNTVTNININPNAGGLQTKSINAGGIVGALPSHNGQLMAGGGPRVKTKGMGYGTGSGYGIQGLKGTAGGRAVAGAVVGEPKLAKSGKAEGLSRAQVMAEVQKHLGEVQSCYERNLLNNPGLAGRMEFEWDISPTGSVTGVRVKRSTVNSGDQLGECVKNIFSAMKFPKATNGMTTTPSIGFPFGRL